MNITPEKLREIAQKLTGKCEGWAAVTPALVGRLFTEFQILQDEQEPVGVVDEADDGLFVDLNTPHGTMVKRGDKLYAAPVGVPSIPKGYKAVRVPENYTLVPIEPTEEMLNHFSGTDYFLLPPTKQAAELAAYKQMLIAARGITK